MHTDADVHHPIESPLGPLLLTGNGEALTGLYMKRWKERPEVDRERYRDDALFRVAREQLAAYFAGRLREFELPLAPRGSDFQQSV